LSTRDKSELPLNTSVRLLRTLLFVPGDSEKKIVKAITLRPDAFIFDLEDSVPPERKLDARKLLASELDKFASSPARIFIRVNGVRTEFLEDDLDIAVHPRVDGLLLPKCDQISALGHLDETLGRIESRKRLPIGKTQLVPILETAGGVICAYELARSSPRIIALNFGAEDYCADMGISRTPKGEEVFVARTLVAQAAHAARVLAIDTVYTDFRDNAGLLEETRRVKQMGYTGKALIHPSQIETVQQAMAPTEGEVEWARRVVQAFQEAQRAGSAVVTVEGRMVDEPVVLQARRILWQSEASRPAANQ
jgi:citrate lyase subunit beta / citryl-CoA lyase